MDDVLNVVEVAPEKPFEFSAPDFGVRVEEPPEDLDDEKLFASELGDLLSQVMTSTAASMQMEMPSATIALSSTLLSQDSNGSRPRISTSVFVRDSLFQQQASTAMDNSTREIVGGIVVDVSLQSDGKVKEVVQSPNSNVVQLHFTKSMVRWCKIECCMRIAMLQTVCSSTTCNFFFSLLEKREATQAVGFGTSLLMVNNSDSCTCRNCSLSLFKAVVCT